MESSISECYKQNLKQITRRFQNFKNITYDEFENKHETELNISNDNMVINCVNELNNDYDFPCKLKLLFYCFESMKSVLRDCDNVSTFEFFSLEKICESKEVYWKCEQKRFIDLVISYAGMGWFFVIAWDKISKKFFLRMDGGSNDWDRESNFGYFIRGEGFDLSDEKFKDQMFDLDVFCDICNGTIDGNVFQSLIIR